MIKVGKTFFGDIHFASELWQTIRSEFIVLFDEDDVALFDFTLTQEKFLPLSALDADELKKVAVLIEEKLPQSDNKSKLLEVIESER